MNPLQQTQEFSVTITWCHNPKFFIRFSDSLCSGELPKMDMQKDIYVQWYHHLHAKDDAEIFGKVPCVLILLWLNVTYQSIKLFIPIFKSHVDLKNNIPCNSILMFIWNYKMKINCNYFLLKYELWYYYYSNYFICTYSFKICIEISHFILGQALGNASQEFKSVHFSYFHPISPQYQSEQWEFQCSLVIKVCGHRGPK